ncbi:MAG TPA: PepSY domain-containing protein [Gammaproteobacteria bacterium]|nr:PepSY domain-containing protein [Gammaproteobacteria bacterium]
MPRKTVFWIHLTCGVTAGLVVLMMSATGVLLTYERQILAWVERSHYADPAPGAPRRPLAALLDAAKLYRPDLTLRRSPCAATRAHP